MIDHRLGAAFEVIEFVRNNMSLIEPLGQMLADTQIYARSIKVPLGKTAPELDLDDFRNSILRVDADGNFSPIFLNGTGGISTTDVSHGGEQLSGLLTTYFDKIDQAAIGVQIQTAQITSHGEQLENHTNSVSLLNNHLTTVRNDLIALTDVVSALDALQDQETDGLVVAIVNETASRLEGDQALAQTISLIGAKSGDGLSFIIDLDTVYVDSELSFADRLSLIDAGQGDLQAAITDESQARADADTALASRATTLETAVNDGATGLTAVNARLTVEEEARASETEALATRATALETTVNDEATGVAAAHSRITDESTARSTADTALAGRATALEATVNDATTGVSAVNARLTTEESARASGDTALASRATALETTVNDATTGVAASHSRITDEATARASADTALGSRATALETSVNHATTGLAAAHSRVTTEETSRTNADTALANRATALESTVNNGTTGVAAVNARLTTEEGARASADTALANRATALEATVNNGTTGVAATYAKVSAEETARANGDAAEATARTTLAAAIRADSQVGLIANPTFSDWPVSTSPPAGWTNWIGSGLSRVAGSYGPYAARLNATPAGLWMPNIKGTKITEPSVIEIDFTLVSGGLNDFGFYVQATGASGEIATFIHSVATELGAGTAGKTYRYRYYLASPPTAAGHTGNSFFVMRWSGIGTNASAVVDVHRVNIRPASDAEIAGKAALAATADLQASITTEASVRASAVGALEAKYGVLLDVNGHVTGFVQNNDGTTGDFIVAADHFKVVRPGAPADIDPLFEVDGVTNEVRMSLPLKAELVGTYEMGPRAMGEASLDYNENGVTCSSTSAWTDIQSIGLTPKSGKPVKIDFTNFAKGTSSSTRLVLRVKRNDGTVIYGGTGGLEVRINDEGVPICIRCIAGSAVDTADIYTLQAKKSVNTEVVTFSQRIAYAEELSRIHFQSFTLTVPSGGGPGTGGGIGGVGGYDPNPGPQGPDEPIE